MQYEMDASTSWWWTHYLQQNKLAITILRVTLLSLATQPVTAESSNIKTNNAPNFITEKNEPRDIEQNGTNQKNRIGSSQALAAILNSYKSEQRNRQIDKQNPIVQRPERSNQRASNLHAAKNKESPEWKAY